MHESPAVVTRVPRISRPLAVFRRRAARKSSLFVCDEVFGRIAFPLSEGPCGTYSCIACAQRPSELVPKRLKLTSLAPAATEHSIAFTTRFGFPKRMRAGFRSHTCCSQNSAAAAGPIRKANEMFG